MFDEVRRVDEWERERETRASCNQVMNIIIIIVIVVASAAFLSSLRMNSLNSSTEEINR